MPEFSEQSRGKLVTCDASLQLLFNEVVKKYDCSVITGYRGKAEQEEAFKNGKSQVHFPNGKHNKIPSVAIDVSPYPIDWSDTKRFYHFAGYVKGVANSLGISIRWGGDWNSDNNFSDNAFNDLVHFEIVSNAKTGHSEKEIEGFAARLTEQLKAFTNQTGQDAWTQQLEQKEIIGEVCAELFGSYPEFL